jgi:hypothetical protein
MGSPVLHLDPANDISVNFLSCQKCNRQTTTLWKIPKEDILPRTTALREDIITNLISKDPYFTTGLETTSAKTSLKSKYLSRHHFSCYLCAIPIIEEQRETKMNETNNQILNDLRNIIRNERPCLEFTHMQVSTHPWGSSYDTTILNLEVTNPKDETQTGIIFCLAPKTKPKEETNYVIRSPNPELPSSYSYTIWSKSAVIDGVKHHRSLHNIQTNDINSILFISQPNPIKTTKGNKRYRSNGVYNPPLLEPNIPSTQRPAASLPISPNHIPLSPPNTPQTRTSPRRSNSSGIDQKSQNQSSSITFSKTHEILWFWYPIFQQSLQPDKQSKSLCILYQHISDYFLRDDDVRGIIDNCIEAYILIFKHLPKETKQSIITTITSGTPDQFLRDILLEITPNTNNTWRDLSQQIRQVLIDQAPLQPFSILRNISNSLTPIIHSIKQRLTNNIDFPIIRNPRPKPGYKIDPAISIPSVLNWKTLPHSLLKYRLGYNALQTFVSNCISGPSRYSSIIPIENQLYHDL